MSKNLFKQAGQYTYAHQYMKEEHMQLRFVVQRQWKIVYSGKF